MPRNKPPKPVPHVPNAPDSNPSSSYSSSSESSDLLDTGYFKQKKLQKINVGVKGVKMTLFKSTPILKPGYLNMREIQIS